MNSDAFIEADADEFVEADAAAGAELVPIPRHPVVTPSNDVVAYRKSLVQEYHDGAPSLLAKLKAAGKQDMESVIVSLIDEIIGETDELKGNELVAVQNGELRDASVISFKRAEVLEKAIRAVQSKQQFEKDSGIDVESPSMMVIFRFFMEKAKESFLTMAVGDELADLFFRTLGESMENWKKELRSEFEKLKNPR